MIRLLRRKAPRNRGFCSNCRFLDRNAGSHHCLRPTSERRDPVSGKPLDIVDRNCGVERADEAPTACGPLGRFYKTWDCGW